MSQDKAVAARAAGKARVTRQTVWTLQVGTIGLRCIHDIIFIVEAKYRGQWERITSGPQPDKLLQRAVSSTLIREAIAGKIAPRQP